MTSDSESPRDKKCAPGKNYSSGACFTLDDLIALSVAYSKEYPDNQINLIKSMDALKPEQYKIYLLKELEKRLDNICDDQRCWLKQDFIKHIEKSRQYQLVKNTFRPDGPMGYDEWLSNFDIEAVMGQYEKKYTDFKFLGAVPLDFDEYPQFKIKNLDFDSLVKNQITKIGIIFNLDKYHQGGSHWVAGYEDLKQGNIYYFDSYGGRPKKEIANFLSRANKYCIKSGIKDCTVEHNKYRHQYGNGACGLYSMAFILRLLKGDSFERIIKHKVSDKEMNDCREIYFL